MISEPDFWGNHVLDNQANAAFGFGVNIEAVWGGNNVLDRVCPAAREFDIDIEIVLRVVVKYGTRIVANHQRHNAIIERIGTDGYAVVFALDKLAVNALALARLECKTHRRAVESVCKTRVFLMLVVFFIEIETVLCAKLRKNKQKQSR